MTKGMSNVENIVAGSPRRQIGTEAAVVTFAVVACVTVTLPAIVGDSFQILDCARAYDTVRCFDLFDISTYITTSDQCNRVRPGFFLMLFPAYFGTNAAWHYLCQSVLLLALPLAFVSRIVYRTTGQWPTAIVTVVAMICQPSFSENYYTMSKSEPFLLLGTIGFTYHLWLVFNSERRSSVCSRVVCVVTSLTLGLLTYMVKETGWSFIAVYVIAIPLISWGHKVVILDGVKRVFVPVVVNCVCFVSVLYLFLHTQTLYTSGGSGYNVTLNGVSCGVQRSILYLFERTPYVMPAFMLMVVCAIFGVRSGCIDKLRLPLAWSSVFFLSYAGMMAPLVPWQANQPRYYLLAAMYAPLFTCMVVGMSIKSIALMKSPWRIAFVGLSIVTVLLLVSHSCYSFLVGNVSEGMVRVRADKAYDEMFEYVARRTASNGTAYFMFDKEQKEAISNTVIGLRLFYGRPDIKCVFPNNSGQIDEAGLVCVTEYQRPLRFNYFRLVVNEASRQLFNYQIVPTLHPMLLTSFYYRTRILFATNDFAVPQYKSVLGVPAIWELREGMYEFGWKVYYCDGRQENSRIVYSSVWRETLKNGSFQHQLKGWSYWGDALFNSNNIVVVPMQRVGVERQAVCIMNPRRKLLGVSQMVYVESNTIYRLSGSARSLATNASEVIFGGRITMWIPPQREQQLIWMSEYTNWLRKQIVFTNQVTGTAVVSCNLGYGGVSSSGEFTDVQFDLLKMEEQQTTKRVADDNEIVKSVGEADSFSSDTARCDKANVESLRCRDQSIARGIRLHEISGCMRPACVYVDNQATVNRLSVFETPFNNRDESRLVSMQELVSLSEVRVVLFGDSIIAIGSQKGVGWHEQLRLSLDRVLESKGSAARVEVIDSSLGGDCTRQMSERVYSDVIAYRPHIVIIHVAKTETWYYNTYFTRLRWIVATIQQMTGAQVVLWTPTPFLPDIKEKYNDLPHYNSVLRVSDETGCGVVDMRHALLNNKMPLKELLWSDGKHPSRHGQTVIARTLASYCKSALSLTGSVVRWSQQSAKAESSQWQVCDAIRGVADYSGISGGRLVCSFTGTWVAVRCGSVECSNLEFYIDGAQPLYSNQFVMFATTPQPHTNNMNTGSHPFNNKIDFCRPLRIFCGTNAMPESWRMQFVSPDAFSVSGSVTGFDGILSNTTTLMFSTSGRVALRPSDVWWAGMPMYNAGDVFEFRVIPVGKNDYSAYCLDSSGTVAAHLPFGPHTLWIDVPATSDKCRVTVTGIDSGSENIVSDGGSLEPLRIESEPVLLVNNGAFRDGLRGWEYWGDAGQNTNWVRVVPTYGLASAKTALRIKNPSGTFVGVKQDATVVSGTVYRLIATARSLGTNDSSRPFGARVSLWLPPQREQQLVWMSQCTNWWRKELVFTNQVTGSGVIVVHVGYGKTITTGEFSDIRLERVDDAGCMIQDAGSLIRQPGTGARSEVRSGIEVRDPRSDGGGTGAEGNRAPDPHTDQVGMGTWVPSHTQSAISNQQSASAGRSAPSLLQNGAFDSGLQGWTNWANAGTNTKCVRIVPIGRLRTANWALRVDNRGGTFAGIQQKVEVQSGGVYRLSGVVRSVATNDSRIMFGGRIVLVIAPQAEQQLVWMSECTNWWRKELVFTNQVTGAAVVYVHLGYGKAATTGEFADIRLERLNGEGCRGQGSGGRSGVGEGGAGAEGAVTSYKSQVKDNPSSVGASVATDTGSTQFPGTCTVLPVTCNVPSSATTQVLSNTATQLHSPAATQVLSHTGTQVQRPCLLQNGCFTDGMQSWTFLNPRGAATSLIQIGDGCVAIVNPGSGPQQGVAQGVAVEAGGVYRLSGIARATAVNPRASAGMVAFLMAPQPERQIVWSATTTNWTEKAVVFTNQVGGTGVVVVQGQGKSAATGEFCAIRLERIAE